MKCGARSSTAQQRVPQAEHERLRRTIDAYCTVQKRDDEGDKPNNVYTGYTANQTVAQQEVAQCKARLIAQGVSPKSIALACFRQAGCAANLHAMAPFYLKHLTRPVQAGAIRRVLLIGVLRGESAAVWSDYFGRSVQLIGLDINLNNWKNNLPQLLQRGAFHGGKNVDVFEADTSSYKSLARATKEHPELNGPFDVIVDDGCHQFDCIMRTFTNVYSRLAEGGTYFVEDNNGPLMQKFITKHGAWDYHDHATGGHGCWAPSVDAGTPDPSAAELRRILERCKQKGWSRENSAYMINVWVRRRAEPAALGSAG